MIDFSVDDGSLSAFVFQEYNPHHGADGKFSSADDAKWVIARDGTRTMGPRHPDHPNNQKPNPATVAHQEAGKKWQAKYDAAAAHMIDVYAAQHGMTRDQYLAACDKHLADMAKDYHVWSRTSESVLGKILNEGEFKNAFQTGQTSGNIPQMQAYLKQRASAERDLLGYSAKTDAKDRPIYGYLSNQADGTMNQRVGNFGNVAIKFKPDVRNNTSFMLHDSWQSYQGKNASMPTNKVWSSVPLTAPNHRVVPSGSDPLQVTSFKTGTNQYNPGAYPEAQIHGGLTTSHIDSVTFYSTPSPATTAKLDAMKIPYTIA